MVISYPGRLEKETFEKKYPGDEFKKSFRKVRKAFDDFGKRTISFGKINPQAKCDGFLAHDAPTLKGTSGGLVISSR